MHRSKLNEGMWANDLADLVQPLVSIDEYSSKIDDSAIVVGFFVQDKDAAEDLDRFIQKSPVSIVDCEVSPAPDQRGYYIVFVELLFNDRLVANIGSLLGEISPLVGVENWQVKCRNLEGLVRFDGEKLSKVLNVNRASDELKAMKRKIKKLKALRLKKEHEKAQAALKAAEEKAAKAKKAAEEHEKADKKPKAHKKGEKAE